MPDPRSDLDGLLDTEHRALLAGDYAALLTLSARKAELLEAGDILEGLARMPDLRHKLARNQALLAMAIRGFRAARRDIEAIRCQRGGFRAYDRNGSRNQVGGAPSGFERKV